MLTWWLGGCLIELPCPENNQISTDLMMVTCVNTDTQGFVSIKWILEVKRHNHEQRVVPVDVSQATKIASKVSIYSTDSIVIALIESHHDCDSRPTTAMEYPSTCTSALLTVQTIHKLIIIISFIHTWYIYRYICKIYKYINIQNSDGTAPKKVAVMKTHSFSPMANGRKYD